MPCLRLGPDALPRRGPQHRHDGRELHWTDDASALLDSLEEWQEKRRVKARVEKSALKKGYTTITREYVEQQYREETGREVESGGCPVSHA